MRKYGSVAPSFWRGQTGREIRSLGQAAQLVAVYLMTSPNSNLIGLYYLPLILLAHETNCQVDEARFIMDALENLEWAFYDLSTETVWVKNMAFYQVAEKVKREDKRWKAIVEELGAFDKSPFFKPFLDVYGEPFHLKDYFEGSLEGLGSPLEAPSKGLLKLIRKQKQSKTKPLGRALEGASDSDPEPSGENVKPLGSPSDARNKEQGTGTRNNEQKQGAAGKSVPSPAVPSCCLPEFLDKELKGIGVVKDSAKQGLLQDLGRHGLRCALVKLKIKAKTGTGATNLAGLLVTKARELAQEGEAILQEAATQALAGAPEALKDSRWVNLPPELKDDLEVQAAWATWIRSESHMLACPRDDEAPGAEKAARRPLLAILAERHPDQSGMKARIEECMTSAGGGLTPPALKLLAMTSALGLAPQKGVRA